MSNNIIDTAVVILPSGDKILLEEFSHCIKIWKVDDDDDTMNPDEVTTVDEVDGVFQELVDVLENFN